MGGETLLVLLILIGIIGKAPLVATSACILLILKLTHLTHYFPLIERRGLEIGLLFLMLSVLIPFANGKVTFQEIKNSLISWTGIFAIVSGAVATYMNGDGLRLLKTNPQLMLGLVLGSIIGIIFFRGIPVGPLMAAGLAAFLIRIMSYFH